jgi:hypothetical protein
MDTRNVRKVIIEDFPPLPIGDMHAQNMKIWADRYVLVGETKGSSMAVEPGRFFLIVTSNYHPNQCFSREMDLEAITRRFSIMEMTKENAGLVKR